MCVCVLTFNDSSLWGEKEEQHQTDVPQHGGAGASASGESRGGGAAGRRQGGSCVALPVRGCRSGSAGGSGKSEEVKNVATLWE